MKVQGKNLFEEFDDDYDEYLPYEDRHDANVAEAKSKLRRFEIPQDRDPPKLVNIEKAILDKMTWERYFKDRNNKDWKYEPLTFRYLNDKAKDWKVLIILFTSHN